MATTLETIMEEVKQLVQTKIPQGEFRTLEFDITPSAEYLMVAKLLKGKEKRWYFKDDENKMSAFFYGEERTNYLEINTARNKMTVISYGLW